MDIALILGAILAGVVLGLFGSGGSIVTVPVLMLVLGYELRDAIAHSLPIVGIIATFGAIAHRSVVVPQWQAVSCFVIFSLFGVYVGVQIAPGISELVLALILGSMMMLASSFLLLDEVSQQVLTLQNYSPTNVVGIALITGAVTGMVGVGGGFLIVPALLLAFNLSMRQAVATSLVIVSCKCVFVSIVEINTDLDYGLIFQFSLIGLLMSYLSGRISYYLPEKILVNCYGGLLTFLSIAVVARQILLRAI